MLCIILDYLKPSDAFMIYYFQLRHPIRHISENIESQRTLTKTTNFFVFYHKTLLDWWKGLTHLL